MSNTTKWDGKPVALEAKKGAELDIRKAKAGDNPAQVFTPDQLKSLWATLAGSGLPVLARNVVLYDKEHKPVQAADQRAWKSKDGTKEGVGGHAYTSAQLAAFQPVELALLMKFVKGAHGKSFAAPLLVARAAPYAEFAPQTSTAKAPLPFQRINAAETPPTGTVPRREG